jgi:hypothetical protein
MGAVLLVYEETGLALGQAAMASVMALALRLRSTRAPCPR